MHHDASAGSAHPTFAPLLSAPDESAVIRMVLVIVVEQIDACEHASVRLRSGRRISRPAQASDATAAAADALQEELQEGPIFAWDGVGASVVFGDVAAEDRWTHWGNRAERELGIRSVLCAALRRDPFEYGVLAVYGRTRYAFHERTRRDIEDLAAYAGSALAARREIATLTSAVASRHVIGQAQGILMERFGMDADHAFSYLTRVSSTVERPVRDVAAHLAATGVIPTNEHERTRHSTGQSLRPKA